MTTNKTTATLLHLSDLHIRNDAEEKTDRSMVLDPLLERLETDYRKGLRPELVLVTGDIAFQGIAEEYALALPFFQTLLKTLHLGTECLYLVPGNHDVYRKAYRPSEIPRYATNREINAELSDADYRADLLKGMKNYFSFVNMNFPHMASAHGDLVPFVDRISMQNGRFLGVVGLNSSWMCRTCKPGEDDSGRIAIGEHQIKSAFAELADKGEIAAALVLFHHPASWLAPMDRQACERYLDRTIALAGHLHKPAGGMFHHFSSQMGHIQAGGAYLGSDSDWPSRYHYLTLDFREARFHLDFRTFSMAKRIWVVDTETGDDAGSAAIPADFLKVVTGSAPPAPCRDLPEFPDTYAVWLKENLGYLEAEKMNPKGKAPRLSLPELYVPLYGADPIPDESGAEDATRPGRHKSGLLIDGEKGESEIPEIESLVVRHGALLIEGQAGCGKSTLIKYLAYCLSPITEKSPTAKELTGYLPVLILLKDLQAYCQSDLGKQNRTCSVGEEMLGWYLQNRLAGTLDVDTVKHFAPSGHLLILVDGLDEIDRPLRDHAVNALADALLLHPENKIALAGRPHGMEGAAQNRFGRYTTSVRELQRDQVRQFVHQWFAFFYPGTTGVGKKTADEMMGEVEAHPAIKQLTVNPLMLTAICLLYLDNRELPDQRAELIKKFIDNMIWRRFDDPEPVLDALKRLAFEMHAQRVRMVDKCVAVNAMSTSPQMDQEANGNAIRREMEKHFDDIEPRCGLIVARDGQVGFWHLIFQAFLAAQHLMDTCADYHDAVADYWDDDWYREVVELYVSYLSIEHRQTANDIVQRVAEALDTAPYRRWRLAARTLVDFHDSRRNPAVVQTVGNRLKWIVEKPLESATLVDAGESLGWLGDDRDLDAYVPVEADEYELEDLGTHRIDAFDIGRYPVTNKLFERFVEDGGYGSEALWTPQGNTWLQKFRPERPRTWQDRNYRCPNLPVTGVSWYEAVAYCNWLTERSSEYRYFLPSEIQWQAAAAGKTKRTNPWGDESPVGRCNTRESKVGQPSPVGIYAGGRTPGEPNVSIHDMAGNVWEWTSTSHKTDQTSVDFVFDEDFKKQLDEGVPRLKGGSWNNPAENARCAARSPNNRYFNVGFRCARTKK